MIRLSWRLQRTETQLAAIGLALFATYMIPAGIHIAAAYTHQNAVCPHGGINACSNAMNAFDHYQHALGGAAFLINVLPGFIGIALAVPLLLELELGTAAFAWTQGVTRARWLRSKLGLAALTAVLAGTIITLLVGWARGPLNTAFGRFADGAFDLQGTVPLAYCLFALGLGLFFGVLLRPTGVALVVAGGAFVGARVFVHTWMRQRLQTPVTLNWLPTQHGPKFGSWYLAGGYANPAGVVSHASERMVAHCLDMDMHSLYLLRHPVLTNRLEHNCLVRLGATYNHAVFFPGSSFWDFQAVETALFVGAAALLIAFASWRVLRAD